VGQRGGNFHILGGGISDQIRQCNLGQKAGTDPAGMSIATESHHGHPHPQRLARGSGAIIGKWIKRNIDPIVERKMCRPIPYPIQEFYPLRRYAPFRQTLQKRRADGRINKRSAFQEQPRVG